MRGIKCLASFIPTSCPNYDGDTLNAVRVAAEHKKIEVQEQVAQHGMAVVTGANPSVGIVGWLTGGGHRPLSTSYGMRSDNLL
jgi:FAD/FMN-containing dehydrogenase